MIKQIKISQATSAELTTIQQIGKETFLETFGASNTAADMKKYLEENFSIEKIEAELQSAGSLFFIAWEDESPVGYLKVNTGNAQTELQDDTSQEIERIYVKSSHHGKKIGQLLYDKALEIALLQSKTFLWLGVWEENPRAIRFYEKNGFVAFDKHIFKMGEDEQTDIMMKKVIK